LLLVAHANASKVDVEMFLFVVDGAVVELLSGSGVVERMVGKGVEVNWVDRRYEKTIIIN
jgi:hypothetical protein